MAPAGEDSNVSEEEEDMPPLCLFEVKGVGHVHDQHAQDHQEERQPGQEEVPSPCPDAVACQAEDDGSYFCQQAWEYLPVYQR